MANIIAAKEFLENIAIKEKKERIAAFALKLPLPQPLISIIVNKVLWRAETEVLWANRDRYRHFVDQVLSNSGLQEVDPVRRLIVIDWFSCVLRKVAVFELSKCPDVVVFDESLSQKALAMCVSKGKHLREYAEIYFESMPVPDALVHCSLDVDATIQRLKNRHKVIQPHHGVSEGELVNIVEAQISVAATGAAILKKRGVLVIDVDMGNSISVNAKKVLRLLGGLR